MINESTILTFTALWLGFFHTVLGPDHYLPFIVMARANNWSRSKTFRITLICGLGHVSSSVLLGVLGITFGVAISNIELFESFRGNLAAWFLIGFGLAYFIWGLRKAIQKKPHSHFHNHDNGTVHQHKHVHQHNHIHVHQQEGEKNFTPWILFTIFVLGPCEPLIPILIYPAAKNSLGGLVLVTSVFGIVTILTMLGLVAATLMGINFLPTKQLQRYMHAIAGATIFLSGLGIQILGM